MEHAYFSRAATWNRVEDRLIVHDSFGPEAPRMVVMEELQEMLFMAANGSQRFGDYCSLLLEQFEENPPEDLRPRLLDALAALVKEELIRLHDEPEELPSYFEEDYFDRDPELRAMQMRKDGLID